MTGRRVARDGAVDASRREFFRTFGRQTARSAGAVANAAADLRRAGRAAADELFALGSADVRADGPAVAEPRQAAQPLPAFSSAYRIEDDRLLVLDQRELPERVALLACDQPTEVASAIRLGAVSAGPVLGELAAYALALAAARTVGHTAAERDAVVLAAANTLRAARTDVHALAGAVGRLEARYQALAANSSPDQGRDVARGLRAEADTITAEAQLAHAALGRHGAAVIAEAGRAPSSDAVINLLMHGDMGPLSCGMVGTGTAALRALLDLGRAVHVWLTEVAPGREGARIGDLQLTQMDVPHTVIPDTAVAWLLAQRAIDTVLLRGDTVCANGDVLAPIGSLNVAQLAADADVATYTLAPISAFDPQAPDGRSRLLSLRSPAEPSAVPGAALAARLTPTTDVVPAVLVTGFVTDTGLLRGGRG